MTAVLADAVYGAAVGDALGVPYEFLYRGEFMCEGMVGGGAHGMPAGTWSDDTSMLVATCDSIRACKGAIKVDDMRARFLKWMQQGKYTPSGRCFDVGNATATALTEGTGCASERSNGNGSLMRIVPLAFTKATDEEVAAVSAITHAHRISTEACVMFVHVARALIAGESIEHAVANNVQNHAPFERLPHVVDLPEDEIESGGYVVHTLEAALWCLANTSDYAECVLKAVNLGRDTDTTACVAGALAGIVYGKDAIPEEWLDALRAKNAIDGWMF